MLLNSLAGLHSFTEHKSMHAWHSLNTTSLDINLLCNDLLPSSRVCVGVRQQDLQTLALFQTKTAHFVKLSSCLTLGTPQTILCSTAHTRLGKIRVPPPRNKVLHVCRLLFNHTIINDSIIRLLFIQDFWERLSQIKCKPSMLFSSSFSFRCSRVCCIPFSRDQPHSRGCVLECFLLVWLLSLLVFCR